MALQEKFKWLVEVTEVDTVQVRKERVIYDDVTGEIVSTGLFHRHVVIPGQDYSGEHPKIKKVCDQIFTPETIAYHQNRLDAQMKEHVMLDAKGKAERDPTPENEAAKAAAEAEHEAALAAAEAAEAAWEAQYDV